MPSSFLYPEAGAGVVLFHRLESFAAAAEAWSTDSPFPLLSCAPLARYADALGVEVENLPTIDHTRRPGSVFSVGGAASGMCGRLLALATGRPHRHPSLATVTEAIAAVGHDYLAVVGLPADLDGLDDWPAPAEAKVGLLTARALPDLVALIYRSLTTSRLVRRPVRSLVQLNLPGASSADVVSIRQLHQLTAGRPGPMVLRTHGRECCLNLPDGVICGRGTGPASPRPSAGSLDQRLRIPSCLQGAGCFRLDLTEREREPAHDLRATVALVDSCDVVAIGVNAFPHETGLALGLLEGTTVAVIGGVGQHLFDRTAEAVLAAALADGSRLGEIVTSLNNATRESAGELGRFGLLGDPALALTASTRDRTVVASGPAPHLPPEVTARLRHLVTELMPTFELLRWLDIPVDQHALAQLSEAVTGTWRRVARRGREDRATDPLGGLPSAADALHTSSVRELSELINTSFWHFGGPSFAAFDAADSHAGSCDSCGRSASFTRYVHRLEPRLQLRAVLCRRCGPTQWQIGPESLAAEHQLGADLRVIHGETLRVSARIRNRGRNWLVGGAGFAFRNGALFHLPGPRCSDLEVAGHATVELEYDFPCDHPELLRDIHKGFFVSFLSGVLTIRPTIINVLAPPAPATDG